MSGGNRVELKLPIINSFLVQALYEGRRTFEESYKRRKCEENKIPVEAIISSGDYVNIKKDYEKEGKYKDVFEIEKVKDKKGKEKLLVKGIKLTDLCRQVLSKGQLKILFDVSRGGELYLRNQNPIEPYISMNLAKLNFYQKLNIYESGMPDIKGGLKLDLAAFVLFVYGLNRGFLKKLDRDTYLFAFFDVNALMYNAHLVVDKHRLFDKIKEYIGKDFDARIATLALLKYGKIKNNLRLWGNLLLYFYTVAEVGNVFQITSVNGIDIAGLASIKSNKEVYRYIDRIVTDENLKRANMFILYRIGKYKPYYDAMIRLYSYVMTENPVYVYMALRSLSEMP
ncbi:MAG: hypothetical protein ACP5GS_08355 [Nitrososphaeria archaeon]